MKNSKNLVSFYVAFFCNVNICWFGSLLEGYDSVVSLAVTLVKLTVNMHYYQIVDMRCDLQAM